MISGPGPSAHLGPGPGPTSGSGPGLAPGSTLALPLTLLLAACGAATTTSPAVGSAPAVEDAGGIGLIAVERPTRGRIWLSLWLDAGARDAQPPAAAALAAWAAAADPELRGRALWEGIELARPCRREELDRCLEQLARALSTRRVAPEVLADARRRLERARQAAVGSATRRADALALEQLLGRPVDPLAGDEAVEDEAVERFWSDHFGSGRAVLVAVGDVDRRDLRERAARAFAGVPSAAAQRRGGAAAGGRGFAVEVGDERVLSVAKFEPSPAAALAAAERLLARLRPHLDGASPSAEVFPAGGGAVLLVRLRGGGEGADQALLGHLVELSEEPATDAVPRPADDPEATGRWLGAGWAARGSAEGRGPSGGLAVGLVVDGGRGDRLQLEDPDARLRDEARRRLASQLERASAPPQLEGRLEPEVVEARFEGARIRARRLPGAEDASVVVLLRGGTAEEPPGQLGLTALLASVAARACARVAREELGAGPTALGLQIEPVLSARAWGLSLTGPAERWPALTYLGPRCAEVPSLNAALVEEERRRLTEQAADLWSAIAASLSPSAPGRLAPTGSVEGLSGLDRRELARWRARLVGRVRATVTVAGDVPAPAAARRVARRLARWPRGEPAEPGGWTAAGPTLTALSRSGPPEAAIGWVVPTDAEGAAVAARLFADAVASSLSSEPGLSSLRAAGGAVDGRAWAAVTVRATPQALDGLPGHVARAIREIAHGWGPLGERATMEAEEERAWSAASARRLARALALPPPEPPSPAGARALLEQLAQAPPRFVVARPPVGEAN